MHANLHATVVSVQVGKIGTVRLGDRQAPSAFGKQPVDEPQRLTRTKFENDAFGNTGHHGGPEKAALLYSASHYPTWRTQFNLDIGPGGLGENVTLDGVDERTVCIGDTWQLGAAVIEVRQPRHPCWKIDGYHHKTGLMEAVLKAGATGWYCRVKKEGNVTAGDAMKLLDRPHLAMTVRHLNDTFLDRKNQPDAWAAIVGCPALSSEWIK